MMRLAGWVRGIVLASSLALALVAGGGRVRAQTVAAGPATVGDALRELERQAAVIFTGQVIAVRRVAGANGATGLVEIEFAVEDAVRGVSGGRYTLREWAGLWPGGEQRFGVGQRFLMLLHAPSAAGLSSPVGGMDGAIPVRGGSAPALVVAARAAGAFAADADATGTDARVLDMRWVATRAMRAVEYRAASPVHTTVATNPVRAEMKTPAGETGSEAVSAAPAANAAALEAPVAVLAGAAEDASYATVLGLLRSWEKTDAGAR